MYLAIITLPLLGSIAAGFFGRKLGVSGAQFIASTSVIVTTILAIFAFLEVGLNNIPVSINLTRWIDSESLNILWGFQFDSLTVYFVGFFYIKEIEAVLVLIQLYNNIFITLSLKTLKNYYLSYLPPKASIKTSPYKNKRNKTKSRGNYYSTLNNINLLLPSRQKLNDNSFLHEERLDSKFLLWFVGFTDAEGNFMINPIINKDKSAISSFSFMFKIALHKDDEKVLRYINKSLGIGGVRFYKNECIFNVTDQKGIALLISIFDKYNLNTSKYLDYLDLKKAFLLYLNRNMNLKADSIKLRILELKNNMNTNRLYYQRAENDKILITKSWLLGFIEGDGSFFLRRDNLIPTFAIENTGVELPVMIKIKEFLESSLGFNSYSLYKLKNSSTIAITTAKARNSNSKSTATLTIKNINVLNNFFIPLFSDVEFFTRKAKDFHDFKIICKLVYDGAHRKEEVRSLLLKLSNTMNNFRLSTYKGTVKRLSVNEINKLLSATPTIQHLIDGRVIDIVTKKVLPRLNSCVYEIYEVDGVFFLANSLSEAASIVGLYPDTLSKYLDLDQLNIRDNFVYVNNYKVRRVRVFSPKVLNMSEEKQA